MMCMNNIGAEKCVKCADITKRCFLPEVPAVAPIRDLQGGSALDTQVGGGHYKDYKIQPVEFLQVNGFNICEANVVKYISRHKIKNGIEDLRKAIHYIQLLSEIEYGEKL